MAITLFNTANLRIVISELLRQPDAQHYGAAIKRATGIDTSAVYSALTRLARAGYLDDLGSQPSGFGGSPRHIYRIKDKAGLQAILDQFSPTPRKIH